VGHLGLFLAGGIAAGLLGLPPLRAVILLTLINVAHEYVVEGSYVDPSHVDLWLDQLGALLGVGLFMLYQRAAK
jgi:hypothetical protein